MQEEQLILSPAVLETNRVVEMDVKGGRIWLGTTTAWDKLSTTDWVGTFRSRMAKGRMRSRSGMMLIRVQ